jgi:hypothetical protein
MTTNQRKARNEAYQLLAIAERILDDAGLIAYAAEVGGMRAAMEQDNKMLVEQEMRRKVGA